MCTNVILIGNINVNTTGELYAVQFISFTINNPTRKTITSSNELKICLIDIKEVEHFKAAIMHVGITDNSLIAIKYLNPISNCKQF